MALDSSPPSQLNMEFRRASYLRLFGIIVGFASVFLILFTGIYKVKVVTDEIGPNYHYKSVSYYQYLSLHPILIPIIFSILAIGLIIIALGSKRLRYVLEDYAGKKVEDMTPNEARQKYSELKSQMKLRNGRY